VLQLRKSRQILADKTISAERMPDMLYQATGNGSPPVVSPAPNESPSKWSEIQPGVFGRFTVIQQNLGRNLLEFRITPGAIKPAAGSVRVSWQPGSPVTRLAGAAPTETLPLNTPLEFPTLESILTGVRGVVATVVEVGGITIVEAPAAVVAAVIGGSLYIGYSIGQYGAQALILMAEMAGSGGGSEGPGKFTNKDAALGVKDGLKQFAGDAKLGINQPTPNGLWQAITDMIDGTVEDGGKVRFNLDGFDAKQALDPGSPNYSSYTSQEFRYVVQNYLNETVFYSNGVLVPPPIP
jgi:hypothetical protein